MTDDDLAALRSGITKMRAISDDRGYEYWSGIHGLPLPISCVHGTQYFLPWHRAYLYLFEQYLMDQEASATLPWWDWSTQQGIPAAYAQPTLADGSSNPLAGASVSGIPDSQFAEFGETPITETNRAPGKPLDLPSAEQITTVLNLDDFGDFTSHLEQIHNNVHVWVGGTMSEIPVAAFDPLFWAHHTMIDRLWAIWQQSHPGSELGTISATEPLGPFAMTVQGVLSITALGYQYAASSSSGTP